MESSKIRKKIIAGCLSGFIKINSKPLKKTSQAPREKVKNNAGKPAKMLKNRKVRNLLKTEDFISK